MSGLGVCDEQGHTGGRKSESEKGSLAIPTGQPLRFRRGHDARPVENGSACRMRRKPVWSRTPDERKRPRPISRVVSS